MLNSNPSKISAEFAHNWELARTKKVYNKDRRLETFDDKIFEEIGNLARKLSPGDYSIYVIVEYDTRNLKEKQWEKYIKQLFEINNGWRAFDFCVKPLKVYSPKRSYELLKSVKLQTKEDSEKIVRFVKGFFMPDAIDFADVVQVSIKDASGKSIYSSGFISSSCKIEPYIKGEYQKKIPYREAITTENIQLALRYYQEVGYYVVQDCLNRNVSVRCAVDVGEGFIARREYYYSFKKDKGENLSGIESKVFNYVNKGRKVVRIEDVARDLTLSMDEAHKALVSLWKKGLLNREGSKFAFRTTDDLLECVVKNRGYEFICNSNRINENYPSKLWFDFDPPEWIDYSICREVVSDFYEYLIDFGFKPRLRTTGGRVGGAHVILSLDFKKCPQNYDKPFPRTEKLEKLIEKRGKDAIVVAAAADFQKSLVLDFGRRRKKYTPITIETTDKTERLHNIYVDCTRCFPNTGARSIGSIHHKNRPGGPYVCRAWKSLPESEKEVREYSTLEYVLKNPEVLNEPPYFPNENPFSLVEETFERTSDIRELYTKNPKKFYMKYIRKVC